MANKDIIQQLLMLLFQEAQLENYKRKTSGCEINCGKIHKSHECSTFYPTNILD